MALIGHLKGCFTVRVDGVESARNVPVVVSILAVAIYIHYWCIAASSVTRVCIRSGTVICTVRGIGMVLAVAGMVVCMMAVGMFVMRRTMSMMAVGMMAVGMFAMSMFAVCMMAVGMFVMRRTMGMFVMMRTVGVALAAV